MNEIFDLVNNVLELGENIMFYLPFLIKNDQDKNEKN